jgi:hypothetical protein
MHISTIISQLLLWSLQVGGCAHHTQAVAAAPVLLTEQAVYAHSVACGTACGRSTMCVRRVVGTHLIYTLLVCIEHILRVPIVEVLPVAAPADVDSVAPQNSAHACLVLRRPGLKGSTVGRTDELQPHRQGDPEGKVWGAEDTVLQALCYGCKPLGPIQPASRDITA